MSGDDSADASATPRDGLAAQLRQLEDFVARSESAGDALPPEAAVMVARLREIMQALDGLSTSFGGLTIPPHVTTDEPTPPDAK